MTKPVAQTVESTQIFLKKALFADWTVCATRFFQRIKAFVKNSLRISSFIQNPNML